MKFLSYQLDNLYWNNSDGFSLDEGNSNTGYKGVTSKLTNNRLIFTLHINIEGKRIYKEFNDIIKAAKEYDFYIKKYDLSRKGNFI